MTVGFIGTGVMGSSMAANLIKAGFETHIFTRTKEKAENILSLGGVWEESIAAIARHCDVIFTIVGYPRDVEEVYLSSQGLIARAGERTILVDMTTSTPELAKRIANEAAKRNIDALDAPVSGGDKGAREGTLTIMAGGEREVFEKVKPCFEAMGKQIILQGDAGSGQHCKMANQIAIASNMMGVCEALVYAEKAGLDPRGVLNTISGGAAASWSLSNFGPRILDGDFAPGFYVKHFIKDMKIAFEASREMGLSTPGLDNALRIYEELEAEYGGEDGTQALCKWYKDR